MSGRADVPRQPESGAERLVRARSRAPQGPRRARPPLELGASTLAPSPDKPKSSGINLFRDHPKEALLVMALTAGGTLAFYAYTTYMQKFLVNTVGLTKGESTLVSAGSLFVFKGQYRAVLINYPDPAQKDALIP